ncbi:SPOC domain-containing protein [Pseudomassariella vexata]|uniref:SPOC domain-domain-containing protein n=1 Tax=Pseudomassariella vexata TaxID=1141098 RepID=A0A1Y2DGP6_9PEZI|nr:SPOC domain-containing protein [Pseudomassariella vexata]ORY58428.1 SPOC domain-domain-containing protein [Pseudomassariella vexata]
MGIPIYDEDIPNKYFCEQCKPEQHKELLDAIARGEKIWETRRQKYEDEKKKGKKGKKGKGKRASDPKERSSPAVSSTKAKASPAPSVKKEEDVPESSTKGKRKSHDHAQGPQAKMRKVSETKVVPTVPAAPAIPTVPDVPDVPAEAEYTPPVDLAETIEKLSGPRKATASGLKKSLDAALDLAVKGGLFKIPAGSQKKTITERHAVEIERANHDANPGSAAASHARSLIFNLKRNVELATRVFNRTLAPTALATMSSDDMATQELQRETAEMKARADKQSILINDDGPRMRKTHKGEEIVENDRFTATTDDVPSALRRESIREASGENEKPTHRRSSSADRVELPADTGRGPLRVDTQGTQQQARQGVDIDKVFSSVRSPSTSHQRRPSAPTRPAGPGVDPEVDRLLQDDGTDSPPYSPTENLDPDVVWQGHLMMTNVADLPVIAKHVGGADLSKLKDIPWKSLIPPLLTVAGRIPEEKAVPYLCGLRYNDQIDLVITSLSPANSLDPASRAQFSAVIDYFRSKQRYGVVGERKLGNVRDTYLVPVSEGDGPIPEPMQNIGDHLIPQNRSEPMLLMVFVVRDDQREPVPPEQQVAQLNQLNPSAAQAPTPMTDRKQSVAAPTWSPATPQQGGFPNPPPSHQSHTPIPPPVIPGQPAASIRQTPTPAPASAPAPLQQGQDVEALRRAQAEGEVKARQVLGPLFTSPTVTFLLPHASRMKEGEWNAVRRCLERDPRAREDLPLLSKLLTEEGNSARQNGNGNGQSAQHQGHAATASPSVAQSTLAAATANVPPGAPQAQPKT